MFQVGPFGDAGQECWICGWFDVEGVLQGIEQFYSEAQMKARVDEILAENVQYPDGSWNEEALFPFTGKIRMVL